MTQHLYIDGAPQVTRDQRNGGSPRSAPLHVADLDSVDDLPICELPIAAIGPSPLLLTIDCLECVRRAVSSTEDRLAMLRERLARLEGAP